MRRRERGRAGARLFAVYAAASLVPVGARRRADARLPRRRPGPRARPGRGPGGGHRADGDRPGARRRRPRPTGLSRSQREPAPVGHRPGDLPRARWCGFGCSPSTGRVSSPTTAASPARSRSADPAFRAAAAGRVDAADPAGRPTGAPGLDPRAAAGVAERQRAGDGRARGVPPLRRDRRQGAGRHQPRRSCGSRVGLVGLYAVLALISWWTTRTLRRHAADHEHQALHDPLTGAAQPRAVPARRPRSRCSRGRGERRRAGADRPRPLQGGQRHPRPPRGRRAAAGRRPPADRARCAPTTPSPGSAATSSGSLLPRRRRPRRRPSRC